MPILNAHPDRLVWMTLHHTTSHIDSSANHLAPSNCSQVGYDIQVMGSGSWMISSRLYNTPGCHAATERSVPNCNQNSIGIGVQGCFGSTDATCNNKGDAWMRYEQKCTVAYVWYALGKPNNLNSWQHIPPHNYCKPTQCCGNNYTGGGTATYNYYNAAGVDLANMLLIKRSCWGVNGACC